MGNFETWYNSDELPRQLEWISNKSNFLNLYEDIKSWYNKDFTDNEFKIIKETWDSWCRKYWMLNSERIKRLWNQIDYELFKYNYPRFASLDTEYIMWAQYDLDIDTQHKFREIIIKLGNEFGRLYNSDVSIIVSSLQDEIQKRPVSNGEIFVRIYEDLLKKIKDNRDINGVENDITDQEQLNNSEFGIEELWNNWEQVPWRIPAREIELMANIPISKDFSDVKDFVLWSISFDWLYWLDENWNREELFEWLHWFDNDWNKIQLDDDKINYVKKYVSAIFNDFARQIDEYFGWNIPSYTFDERNIWIILDYFNAIISGEETSAENLVQKILEKLYENDDTVKRDIYDIHELERKAANKINREEVEKIEVTEKEKNDIKIRTRNSELSEDLLRSYKLYKYLSNKKAVFWKLDPDLEKILHKLTRAFKYIKRRVLREVSFTDNWLSFWQEYSPIETNSLAEYATWSIKDIKPIAIVESNNAIRDYVYWGIQDIQDDWVDNITFSSLFNEKKESLLKKLIDRNKNNREFMSSIRYLDKFWNIDVNKARADNIDPRSLNKNKIKIQNMIVELAKEELQIQWEKEKIRQISIKRSAMVCCFRAISSFFNTVNNNWENFASEFEISDVNENIKFDETTGMITMEWTIWVNKNHIKLYYDTKNWTLEFDNFLAYDPETSSYKIWHWNWAREKVNIKLPTMEQMQAQADSVNLNLIDRFSTNIEQYERMVWFAMWESIRLNCFVGFMWADMKVSKIFVEQFNEKNILKQDIINSIYSKFYSQSDMKTKFESFLNISRWNEPEQFKLIELIVNTIDNCSSSNELLSFRNAMNELDDILSNNHELVIQDSLLQYFFADNLNNNNDTTDTTRSVIDEENEDWNTSQNSNDQIATYESQDNYANNGNKTLNYYMFLDLLSEDKWGKKIININAFQTELSTIKTSWKHLLDDKNVNRLLWKNYLSKVGKELPNLCELEDVQRDTVQELQDLERDIRLENELGEQLDQAYA